MRGDASGDVASDSNELEIPILIIDAVNARGGGNDTPQPIGTRRDGDELRLRELPYRRDNEEGFLAATARGRRAAGDERGRRGEGRGVETKGKGGRQEL